MLISLALSPDHLVSDALPTTSKNGILFFIIDSKFSLQFALNIVAKPWLLWLLRVLRFLISIQSH